LVVAVVGFVCHDLEYLFEVFGPLTYYAGAQLGAASFDSTPFHFGALAITWGFALPVLVYAAKHFFTPSKGLS